VFLPSIAFAARVLPALDVGLRLSAAQASIKSTTALWATLGNNYQEDVSQDGTFSIDAKDSFVPTFGLGLAYRPTSNIELGFNYSHQLSIHAKGTSISEIGPNAGGGLPVAIGPNADENARCAPGGTMDVQKACVDFALPSTAQLGGRYKFLDGAGALKADVELDLSWENWGKSCSEDDFNSGSCVTPGDYRVVPDSSVYIAGNRTFDLRDAIVHHGLRDSYGVRVGGSYHVPLGSARERGAANEVIVRGGIGYDTAAAKPGWLRADLDGAARTTLTVGAAYRMRNVEISAGGGAILEGSPTNPNIGGGAEPCNTTDEMPGCGPSSATSATSRQGPDPIDPLRRADNQAESPIGQGDYKSHYVLFMLGATAWF
jgi:long-subunit fatty acid transport protein